MLASLLLSLALSGSPVSGAPVVSTAPKAPTASTADAVPVLDEDANVVVDYDLDIDLAGREIDVDMQVDITYVKAQEQDGNRILRYFMTEWHAFLPSSAVDIAVADVEGPLPFVVEDVDQPGLVLVKVDFRRDLSSGESLMLSMGYSLPSEPPPIELDQTVELILEDQVVVNEAAVAWAFYSDPRADAWTAEFNLPPGFADPDDDTWRRRPGTRTFETSGDEFVYDFVVIENDEAMVEAVVPFDGQVITVRHWPGDDEWRERVTEQITDNLPTLVEAVGRSWPERPLVVQQSAQTLGTSYGGWFTSSDHRITIGRSVSPELILHELAHVWFQYDNLADRWLIEGLADEFASLAAHGSATGPEPDVSLQDGVAFPLDEWVDPPSIDDTTATRLEAERWAYQASSYVTRATREMIGADAFTEATRSVLGGARSYPGPDDASPEPGNSAVDPRTWHEFLDLAAAHTVDENGLAELYARWVVGEWTDQFEQRSAARERHEMLQQAAGGAVLPTAVRTPMREWRFDAADDAMAESERLLDEVERLRPRLVDRDLSLPSDFEDRLARLATVDEISTYRVAVVSAGDDVMGLLDRIDSLDRWQRIGLVGTDIDALETAAIDTFTAGDLASSRQAVLDGERLLDGTRRRGVISAGVAVTALAVAMGPGVWILRRRRRRRRRRPDRQEGAPMTRPGPPLDAEPVIDLTDGAGPYSSSSSETTTSQRS